MTDSPRDGMMRSCVNGVLGGVSDRTVRAGKYAVTLTRLDAGLRLPSHAHEQATLNLVLDGHYGEIVEWGRFQSHGPATLILKPAGAVHQNVVGNAPVECVVVDLGTTGVGAVEVRRSANVARFGGKLRVELIRCRDDANLIIEELIAALLSEATSTRRRKLNDGGPWLERARELLHDEPAPQSLGDLGQRVGRHPVYLARAFRARFGCSVGEYVRCLRLERARRLLHDRRVSLSEAAASAGYSDQSHMTRDFQREFCFSPGTYRKHLRQVR